MDFIVSDTQFIRALRRFWARLEKRMRRCLHNPESDFIAHTGSLVNYVLVTCLLGLISLFALLFSFSRLAPAIPHAMQSS